MTEKTTPLFRAGIFSDVQALATRHNAGMYNFRLALDFFKSQKTDLLINAGDYAEGSDPETFQLYWEMIEERFGKDGVAHIGCDGNHECGHGQMLNGAIFQQTELWKRVCQGYRRGTENPYLMEYKGFSFLTLSASDGLHYSAEDLKKLDDLLSRLAAKDPVKPIFLITHFAPLNTMIGSHHPDSSKGLREVLNRHPQVVSISGHMHIPLNDERDIWQGEFTAFATCTLAYGGYNEGVDKPFPFNTCCGILPFARECIQALLMDVYADHLEIRRYHILDGCKEISPEYRWNIPFPYDPAKAIYTDVRAATRTAPGFPEHAELLTRYDFGYMFILFERANTGDFAQFYDVEIAERLADGKFAEPSVTRYIGDFYRLDCHQHDLLEFRLPGKGMKENAWYRIRVYPVECFGKRGKPLEILEHAWPGYIFKDGATQYPQE